MNAAESPKATDPHGAALELVRELLSHRTREHDEQRILSLVQELPSEQLNELLDERGAERLVQALDNRIVGPDNHRALLEILVDRRSGELELHATAALIHALQTGRTSTDEERRIADLICQLHGQELTHLKNIINLRNDHHDLEGLVFIDIDDDGVRQRILDHISSEGQDLSTGEAKVLSDIDDTVFCKLHDKRYPRGTLYPGVLAFQEALDRGPDDDPTSLGDLTFVTARPGDFFGLVENHSRESLKKAGIADLSLMSGSLFNLFTLDSMAGKKLENIDHYIKLFPEYRMTFMGDSGQGDVKVGEKLWESYGGAMDAVFIHDVVATPDEKRAEYASRKIWFHDTYVGAANKALELGLISAAGREHVVAEARRAISEIPWQDQAQQDRMSELLERDIADAPPRDAR
ncbi:MULTISPECIES: phosphatase domain-containing protein [unclassified Luteococcus]|uniref:phosphatase domain-containing protein n=1 Tax=unclassified Luteococcus TaxID=2639923 RepID=UPI00313C1845